MGEQVLKNFWEILNENYVDGKSVKYLKEHNITEYIIKEAMNEGLIEEVNNFDSETRIRLNSKGFLALNQIRLKKATDKLNGSIEEFSNTSTKQTKKIIWLTVVMILLIIGQLIIASIMYFKPIK